MRVGDLVRFSADHGDVLGPGLLGILVAVSQPKGLPKPIATVFWTSINRKIQHLREQLEVISGSG